MKLTLIKPNMGRMMTGSYVDEGRMEPLQIGILAALTPSDVEVVFYDDRMEDIPFEDQTDLVAITVETFTAKRAYEIAAIYREKKVPVVIGGMHPTLLPEEAMRYADAIMTGDAENVWTLMIEDAKSGLLKKHYKGDFSCKPQKNVFPRRDLFENKGYLPISLMQFSRGCTNGCHFCATSVYFNKTHHCRDIQAVVDEIKSQKLKLVFFVDDNIVSDHERAKDLFRALIPLKIKWVSQASIDMTEDEELMRLMMKSGCLGNVIGFESIKAETLSGMNKGHNIGENFDAYKGQLQILRKYGHQTWAAFTIGHDEDTLDSIYETLKFAKKNKFAFAAFNVLMPYPSTKLYEDLKSQNRLLYDGNWWLHDDFRFNHAPYMPQNMTSDDLTQIGFECRKSFNSITSIIYRATDLKTNMRTPYKFITYLIYNPLFRKEVYKKQSMILGNGEKS
ncbi:B12-binding domain-containing radical SAM protein [Acidaminobacter sp. JC074]|uniref:B12-binding domain-containing radical SAM protein n=1 Tax=Acidaminobacter sp. JC074 TaxID=2530199 RepID=UPI001F1093F5|nr:radical SAM protein [Acidaminobacter sp. JC074]MCH4887814.1 B12-binding domain-containing radical SAM protein [Acidaminobacter sp. JC074]